MSASRICPCLVIALWGLIGTAAAQEGEVRQVSLEFLLCRSEVAYPAKAAAPLSSEDGKEAAKDPKHAPLLDELRSMDPSSLTVYSDIRDGAFVLAVPAKDIANVLNSLKDANVLARPSLAALIDQECQIKLVQQIPAVRFEKTTKTDDEGMPLFRQRIVYEDVGVSLNVTPKAADSDEKLGVHLGLEVSNVVGWAEVMEGEQNAPAIERFKKTEDVTLDEGKWTGFLYQGFQDGSLLLLVKGARF